MPDFSSALRTRLQTDAGVSAMVGTKVFRGIVPETTALPYIRMQVVSDPRPEYLKGYEGARVSRVQVDCFAKSYGQARDIADRVIAATIAPGVTEGVHFGRIKAEGPRDLGEDVAGSGYVHRASLDLLAEHRIA